jgi:hypothetical protein
MMAAHYWWLLPKAVFLDPDCFTARFALPTGPRRVYPKQLHFKLPFAIREKTVCR